MIDREAIAYLRDRRSLFFFGDRGPPLAPGVRARWRLTPQDPRGWHANMVGFVEAPREQMRAVLEQVINWFGGYGADSWLDADEYSVLFHEDKLIESLDFRLADDWDAMLCRELVQREHNPDVLVRFVQDESELYDAAWIAQHMDRPGPIPRDDERVRARAQRFVQELRRGSTTFVLAFLNGALAGTARLTEEDLPVAVGVVTLPHARGHGVATAVTSALARKAIEQGSACALYAERESRAARIYRRLGFSPLFRSRAWVRRLR